MRAIISFILLSTLFYSKSFANDEKNTVAANLKTVTVFRSGAELIHTAKANLTRGDNELVVGGISSYVDINSIQVNCPAAVTILGIEFSNNYLVPENTSPVMKKIKDSIEKLTDEIEKTNISIATTSDLLSVLKSNKEIKGSQTGLSVSELIKLMDYYKVKSNELQADLSSLNIKKNKLTLLVVRLNSQAEEESKKNIVTGGQIILQLSAATAGEQDFTISYFTQNAYWTPFYDVKAENINSPLKIIYKAKIVQTSGIDWKKVKLSLSTSTPSQYGAAPLLKSWFLTYIDPVRRLERNMSKSNTIPSAYYKEEGKQAIDENANLRDKFEDYVSVTDNALDVTYDIELPYDVPTNGKQQVATLKEASIPAIYKYYAVPKLDKDAYLLAEVTDWEKLNLLPGEANIIFEGTFVGKSFIDPASTNDTLNLTMGKDKRVIIKREKLTDYSSIKLLGTNKLQTITYEITVKNNKKDPIMLVLKDQYPVSMNKDIEVELLQSSGAVNNAEIGVLTWKLDLAAGESKKVRISYSAKYPKGKVLNLN